MHATVVIVGAGQAGLAMSRCLTERSIDHVLLERGVIANSWRTERWDSLRLLTPNWMTRLPGSDDVATDTDGYETATQVADRLAAYSAEFVAPVRCGVTVTSVAPRATTGYTIDTDRGTWTADAVVIAAGACSTPRIPSFSADLPVRIRQLSPIHYRNPSALPDGDVLVVGASASGLQLADEIAQSGRNVTLCVGTHTRMPRTHRGRDVLWWMNEIGWLDQTIDQFDDLGQMRRSPSMQLIGTPERRTLDLNALRTNGVTIAGRLDSIGAGTAMLDGSLPQSAARADTNMFDLVMQIEKHIADHGLAADLPDADVYEPTNIDGAPTTLDLDTVGTVIWATGFRPHTPWLDNRWLDERGAIRHDGGIVDPAGVYALGLPYLRRRKSNFIDGVGPDAAELCEHLADTLVALATT